MAEYNVGAVLQVYMAGTLGLGDVWGNTYQFQLAAGDTPLTFDDVVADMGEVVDTIALAYSAYQSELWLWDRYSVNTLDGGQASGIVAMDTPRAGTKTDPPLPSQTTVQVAYYTQLSGRILKKALMGFVTTQVDSGSGNWLSTLVSNLRSESAAWLLPIEATKAAWVYCYNPTPGVGANTIYPRSVRVNPTPKVQRRRRIGSGA